MPYIGNQAVVGDSANTFKLLDDISTFTLTFDGSSTDVVSVANNTLTFANHRFITGQRVTYTDGGGTVITGLTDGTAYFIIKVDQSTIKLATNASNAASSTAIDLTGVGAGTSHTLNVAFDGVNTKFKATHTSGIKSKISRAAQISLSINGVIQQPQDTSSPTVGYGVEADSTIVFSTAPVATDKVFGSFIGEVAPSFDLTDNTVDNFTGDGSTTTFTLSKETPSSQDVLVTLDGVTQYPSDASTTRSYSVVNQGLTFTSAPANGVAIQARHIGFAGATTSEVTGFYGRTGNVALTSTDDISVQNISAGIITATTFGGNPSFTGNVSIGGTLTYEDVTNVDSVGLITARNGIVVGSGITLSKDGDIFATGVTTTGSLVSSGAISGTTGTFSGAISGTTGTFTGDVDIADKIVHTGDTDTAIRFSGADTIQFETGGSSRLQINSSGHTVAGGDLFADADLYMIDYLKHTGDTNTSIRFPAADTVSVETGGSERARIDSAGRLGIGENSPSAQLHVSTPASTTCEIRLTANNTGSGSGDRGRINVYSSRNDGTAYQAGRVDIDRSSGTEDKAHLLVALNNGSGVGEKLRITSSGQVFIGESVTSSYDAVLLRNTDGNTVAQIVNTNTGSSVQSILQLQVGSDRYVNFATNYTNQYLQIQGVNIATSYHDFDTQIFRTNSGTEGMRLDSAGNLDVKGGMISISKQGALNHLEIGNSQTNNQFAYMDLIGDTTYTDYGTRVIRGNTGANAVTQILHRGTGAFDLQTQDSASINLYTGSVKRIEFDPNGAIYPSQNGAYFHFKAQNGFLVPAIFQNTGNNIDYTMIQFRGWNNSATGYISTRVNITTYGTSSDARIKENIVDTSNGIERVKQLRPVQFNFIANKEETMDGFLAQEAKNVVPVSVAGDPDAVDENGNMIPLVMDNSKLVPILTKALQEAIDKIETLETKVAALEG